MLVQHRVRYLWRRASAEGRLTAFFLETNLAEISPTEISYSKQGTVVEHLTVKGHVRDNAVSVRRHFRGVEHAAESNTSDVLGQSLTDICGRACPRPLGFQPPGLFTRLPIAPLPQPSPDIVQSRRLTRCAKLFDEMTRWRAGQLLTCKNMTLTAAVLATILAGGVFITCDTRIYCQVRKRLLPHEAA